MKSSELYLKGVHELRKTSLTTLCAATALAGIISLFGGCESIIVGTNGGGNAVAPTRLDHFNAPR